jgi:hypothetical protein
MEILVFQFGLKKCALMDQIKGLHRELGYGNPAFPRIPHTIPHEYYITRLGRERPFEQYKDALNFPNVVKPRPRFANSNREEEFIRKLHEKHAGEKQKEFERKVADIMTKKMSDSAAAASSKSKHDVAESVYNKPPGSAKGDHQQLLEDSHHNQAVNAANNNNSGQNNTGKPSRLEKQPLNPAKNKKGPNKSIPTPKQVNQRRKSSAR